MPVFEFEAKCLLRMERHREMKTSTVLSTDLLLNVSSNLKQSEYVDPDGLPTKPGSEALTSVLIAALVTNINNAHQRGFRNDAEHIRYIIQKLSEGFVIPAEAGVGTYEPLA